VVGHRADRSRTHEMELSCEQTIRCRGVCAPALEPRGEWEGFRKRCQGFKPDLGNSAVRHYRGASGNVAMAELRTHLATERVRVVSLRLKQTRPSSIPTIEFRPSSTLPCCSRVTLVLYRKRTARRFRLASTSGVRFRYSRQKEAARGCGGRGALWEFNRFLPEKPCQTGTLAKTILLIFTM